MKKYGVLVLLLFATGILVAADNDTGRFQIVSGTAETVIRESKTGGAEKASMIIKIDTQTGQTWTLARIFSNGEYREGWIELGNFPASKTPTTR